MPRRESGYQSIAQDIIDACEIVIDRETAVKGVRNLCRYFGGCLVYIPLKKKDGRMTQEMYNVISDTVGKRNANIIIDKMMALFGPGQVYIPLERYAFEDVIAEEIYRRNTDENVSISAMFRDYGICYSKVYKLWHKGREIKLNKLNREGKRKK
jgi:Mor family transcriptional regulator